MQHVTVRGPPPRPIEMAFHHFSKQKRSIPITILYVPAICPEPLIGMADVGVQCDLKATKSSIGEPSFFHRKA